MQAVQREIAEQLKVQPPFADHAALDAEIARRIRFIQDCLVNSGLKTLVLEMPQLEQVRGAWFTSVCAVLRQAVV